MLPIQRINNKNSSSDYSSTVSSSTSSTSTSSTFDAFSEETSMSREADQMQWLSRPNLRLVSERLSSNLWDLERFRISFDVTGFRQENIKVSNNHTDLNAITVGEEKHKTSPLTSLKNIMTSTKIYNGNQLL
jgi:hypothetical protein